jgi:hypothetical protein
MFDFSRRSEKIQSSRSGQGAQRVRSVVGVIRLLAGGLIEWNRYRLLITREIIPRRIAGLI